MCFSSYRESVNLQLEEARLGGTGITKAVTQYHSTPASRLFPNHVPTHAQHIQGAFREQTKAQGSLYFLLVLAILGANAGKVEMIYTTASADMRTVFCMTGRRGEGQTVFYRFWGCWGRSGERIWQTGRFSWLRNGLSRVERGDEALVAAVT